jgi:hypothetical protein
MNKTKPLTALMTTLLLLAMLCVTLTVYGQAGGNTISSDTTWTAANSPYTITLPIVVAGGVTLTIQPGVTVDINQGAYLQVDGALNAVGSGAASIQFTGGGSLILVSDSAGYNPTTGSGCIIQNAKVSLNSYNFIVCCSALIETDSITGGIYIGGGSPTISSNKVTGEIDGNESIQAPLITNNTVVGAIYIEAGSPVITKNVVAGIEGSEEFNGTTYLPSLCDAIDVGPAEQFYPVNAVVTDNTVTCGLNGISAGEGPSTTAIIQNNLVENCSRDGMSISSTSVVENNTLINNNIGMFIFNFYSGPSTPAPTLPTVMGNNILHSSQYNIYYQSNMNLTATYNWWGTTDPASIAQTIYDHNSDPSVGGTVIYLPCLTAPNPMAYPNPNAPVITTVATSAPASTTNDTLPTQTTSTNYFSIESNSTVTDLAFNSTSEQLSFTVSGPTGTAGFAKVTIAKTLMPNGDLQVYMDGKQIPSTKDSNSTYWIITFTYHHSTHRVTINSADQTLPAQTAPIQNLWILAAVLAALTAFGGIIFYTLRHNPKTPKAKLL